MTAGLRHFPGDPARPALALHCMMGSAASWGAVVERLGGRIDVSAPDLTLHGRGPAWQAGGESFADATLRLARPLAETLAARAADGRIDLIGHSFGAVAALRLALHAPARVRSLTLIEPVLFAALPAPERDPDGLLPRLEQLEAAGDRAGSTAAFLRYWNGPDLNALPAPAQAQMVAQMAGVLDTMGDLYDDRGGILAPGGLEALAVPVMLIRGAGSAPVMAPILEALAARLPDVGVAVVPGAGHMVPLTHPAEVAGLVAVNLDRA